MKIKSFKTWDGIEIAYQEWGEETPSPPVVLHHGFVANADANWVAPGVVDVLLAAGRRVIAPDARGHGRSEKPHDPARYGERVADPLWRSHRGDRRPPLQTVHRRLPRRLNGHR